MNRILDEETIVYVDFLTQKQYKSRKQNNTFHALLDCFWKSGCSSFVSQNEMRFYYKRSVGLIQTFMIMNLEATKENMIWQAVKLTFLSHTAIIEVQKSLKGQRFVKEMSWSVA